MDSSLPVPPPSSQSKLSNLAWFGFLVAAVVWASCAYFHFYKLISAGDFFAMSNTTDGVQTNDSVLFYAAGEMGRRSFLGKAPLYDSEQYKHLIDEQIAPIKTQDRVKFQYPPYFFLYLTPLPSFNLAGAWLFNAVLSAVYLSLGVVTIGFPLEKSKFGRALMIALAFLWFPSYWCCRLGQNSLLLFAIVGFIWQAIKTEKFGRAGILTAFIFKVQYLPIIATVGIVLGGWKYCRGLVLGGMAALALGLICYGVDNTVAFPQAMVSGEHANGAGPFLMDTVRGFLTVVPGLPEKDVTIISVLALVAALAFAGYLWRQVYPALAAKKLPSFELCAAITTILLMVTSLHAFTQDYVLLLFAAFWSWSVNRSVLEVAPGNIVAKFSNGVMLALPAVSWVYGYLPVLGFTFKVLLWGSLLLLICDLKLLRQAPKLQETAI